jgi:hypothetical protein
MEGGVSALEQGSRGRGGVFIVATILIAGIGATLAPRTGPCWGQTASATRLYSLTRFRRRSFAKLTLRFSSTATSRA